MGRVVLNSGAIARISREPGILRVVKEKVADEILRESQAIAPVLSGHLKASGFSETEGNRVRVGYTADYATYVHEGTRYQRPQNFLESVATRDRGRVG